jgi:hypothetical protein
MGKNTNKRIKRSKRNKRNKRKTFKGGMIPFVGSPLNYNIFSTYPGVSLHGGNHYGLNPWKNDLYTGNITDERNFSIFPNKYVGGGKSIKGGYMYKKNPKKSSSKKSSLIYHRGGLAPLLGDAINGVENIGTSLSNVYNGLVGQPSNVSSLPYIQPKVQMA